METENSIERAIAAAERDAAESNRASTAAAQRRASKSQRPVYASESKSQWVAFVAQLPHILVAAAIGVAAVLERLCSTVSTMGVLLMVPALGLFEAGLLRAKNSVSVLIQCFAGVAVLTVLWFVIGFSLCFSQGMFAAITPLLTLLVYYPLCHWVWGGGWLARLGVCDFAGGIVIHTSAGVASLVTALRLGPRVGFAGLASHSLAPHNLPMAATGAGLLWVGWFAFNGGSALAVGSLAASALLSTHVAGAGGALVWLALDWGHAGRPTFVGCINGALSGLAGVTPASGYVTPSAGLVVGLEYLRIDDALDVTSIHGVTGVVGSLLLGVYASSEVNPAGPDGSLDQLRLQALGVAVAIAWSGAGTWLAEELDGLDRSQHAESSYLDLAAFVKHATPTTDELFEGANLALGDVSPAAKRRSGQSLSARLASEIAEAAMV
ncbi:hypothetical protein EMIHUDRAFT_225229 [Emiliania huxleyi CCMP1516]|uniref:Ammonium transporter AmtB-like domain-containing protein n=2 Tax=Emiliania huxleyi TaxID=2903 RepID=A0A0D3KPG9_EMIH1|nr:hypothetical protein EMIHUDRAFT_225229 [Emiliania huxleyi CCMP1516]EOD37654.1 hypothetical protein EMIHUDRAFT_225229 [Emiliania huxleyi CCMP1516]|eukprot:XP_005790083.1 hypothetical protein EMIHUDRAFT_225229 [Emiliania huxleyi CCMP1516]